MFDFEYMSNNNELIAQIESARNNGTGVKSIRRQKFDPNHFYMTRSDGKQLGPVKVDGNIEQLNSKFEEAQAYLSNLKSNSSAPRKAA